MEATPVSLYWIGGAATAGKTTVVSYLGDHLPTNFCVYDFDDIGMPSQPYEQWRRHAIRSWLNTAMKNAKQKHPTVIGGAIFLTEILEHRDILGDLDILFCVLVMSPSELRRRMRERFCDDAKRELWLKSVGMGLEESIELNMETMERYKREAQKYEYLTINTSQLIPDLVGTKVAQWIVRHCA